MEGMQRIEGRLCVTACPESPGLFFTCTAFGGTKDCDNYIPMAQDCIADPCARMNLLLTEAPLPH